MKEIIFYFILIGLVSLTSCQEADKKRLSKKQLGLTPKKMIIVMRMWTKLKPSICTLILMLILKIKQSMVWPDIHLINTTRTP